MATIRCRSSTAAVFIDLARAQDRARSPNAVHRRSGTFANSLHQQSQCTTIPGLQRMAGHSRSKNGVASLADVPATPIQIARQCHNDRDARTSPGMTAGNCVTNILTFVTERATSLQLAHRRALSGGMPECGASAAPAGGFAVRSRAVLGIVPAGITTGLPGVWLTWPAERIESPQGYFYRSAEQESAARS
jgi:hypothetical protein